jgi:hypothetical protein
LGKIEDETRQIQNGVGDIHEMIFRQEREISGMRQDLRLVFDQISQSPGTRQQRTYLEHRFTGVQTQNRSLSATLPPTFSCMTREIYKMSLTRQFWFGLLDIASTTDSTWRETLGKDYKFDTSTAPLCIKFSFLPPSWVSDMFIRIIMDSSMTFNLDRTRINQDPRLIKCLRGCNVEGLKVLFSEGRAKPTDMVLDLMHDEITPESLLEVNYVLNGN